jgi:hypothetical protein
MSSSNRYWVRLGANDESAQAWIRFPFTSREGAQFWADALPPALIVDSAGQIVHVSVGGGWDAGYLVWRALEHNQKLRGCRPGFVMSVPHSEPDEPERVGYFADVVAFVNGEQVYP